MILVVGLGNPGKKYEKTRHNLGFRAVDEFARKNNFSDFKLSQKFNAEISEGEINGQKIILAKPQTFMNLSGIIVKSLYTKYKIQDTKYILAIHDDIDLLLGKIRIVKNRGSAGHKGVESIIRELKTENFIRFRIGIKPKSYILPSKSSDKFVLQKFNKEEEKIVKEVIQKTVFAIEIVLKEGLEKAMNEFNN